MKKLILSLLCFFTITAVDAQYLNFFNDEGDVVGTVETNVKDTKTLYKKVRSWAVLMSDGDLDVNDEKTVIELSGKLQTSSAYNPFAGSFTDFIQYSITINIEAGKVFYEFNDLALVKKYEGFGKNEEIYLVSELVDIIVNNEAKISKVNASNKNKRDKKKAIKKLKADKENFSKALAKVKETIEEKIEVLENKL